MTGDVTSTGSRQLSRLHVGAGAVERLGPELKRVGSLRPLFVMGRATARDSRLWSSLQDALAGRESAVAAHVRPDVPLASVLDIAADIARHQPDSLVAVGGGAAITAARAANILAHEPASLTELCTAISSDGIITSPHLRGPRLPQIAVPTTPTTAAPKAGAAVTIGGLRHALYDPRTRAAAVIVDPLLGKDVPPRTIESAALNALVMALEGWLVSPADTYATLALRGSIQELADLIGTCDDQPAPDQRERLLVAGVVVGEVTDLTGGGMTAALSHTLGPHVSVANGVLDALLFPHVLDRAPVSQRTAFESMCDKAGVDVLGVLERGLRPVSEARRLRDLALPVERLEALAVDTARDVSAWADRSREPSATALSILRSAW